MTSLVHEAFLRLARSGDARVNDDDHFLAFAARAMRCVLATFVEVDVEAFDPGGEASVNSAPFFTRSAFTDLDEDGRLDLLVLPNDGDGPLPDSRLLVFAGRPRGRIT